MVTWCAGLKQRHSPHTLCRTQGVTDYIIGVIVIIVGSSLQSLGLTVLKVGVVHHVPCPHCTSPTHPVVGLWERGAADPHATVVRDLYMNLRGTANLIAAADE